MSAQTVSLASLLILAACSVPQTQMEPIVLPVVVVEGDAPKKDEEKPKTQAKKEVKPEAKPEPTPAEKKKELCSPKEGETEKQRLQRKLDCLIETE